MKAAADTNVQAGDAFIRAAAALGGYTDERAGVRADHVKLAIQLFLRAHTLDPPREDALQRARATGVAYLDNGGSKNADEIRALLDSIELELSAVAGAAADADGPSEEIADPPLATAAALPALPAPSAERDAPRRSLTSAERRLTAGLGVSVALVSAGATLVAISGVKMESSYRAVIRNVATAMDEQGFSPSFGGEICSDANRSVASYRLDEPCGRHRTWRAAAISGGAVMLASAVAAIVVGVSLGRARRGARAGVQARVRGGHGGLVLRF